MISTIKVECDLQTLMLVLEATGNSKIAMDILSHRYVEPNIYPTKIGRWDTKKHKTVITNELGREETVETEEQIPVMYTFVSYNPFTDTVTYKRNDGWKRQDNMSLEEWNNLEYPFNDADQQAH